MAPSGLNSKKFLDMLCGCNLPLKLTEAKLTQKINYFNTDTIYCWLQDHTKVISTWTKDCLKSAYIWFETWFGARIVHPHMTKLCLPCVYLDVMHMRKCTRLSPEGKPWNMALLSKGRAHACFLTLFGIHMYIYEPWMGVALIESDPWNETTCPFYPSIFHISLHPHLPVTTSLFALIHLLSHTLSNSSRLPLLLFQLLKLMTLACIMWPTRWQPLASARNIHQRWVSMVYGQ